MPSRRLGRPVSEEERRLWRAAMRDAKPLRETGEDDAVEAPPEPSPPPAELSRDRFMPPQAPARRGAALDPERPVGLDRRTWQRLRRGQMPLEAVLDLHGDTQDVAHRRLAGFIADAERRGIRCVLVVTGKGQAGGGVLRHMVPRWLNETGVRERLIAIAPAHRRHGGGGALYVLIRRPRARR